MGWESLMGGAGGGSNETSSSAGSTVNNRGGGVMLGNFNASGNGWQVPLMLTVAAVAAIYLLKK